MQLILLSIKNKHWNNIVSGNKSVDIRKSKPKNIKLPFKCLCYVSGKGILGSFICDKIIVTSDYSEFSGKGKSCLSETSIKEYAKNMNIYAWHIQSNSVNVYSEALSLTTLKLRRSPQTWQRLTAENLIYKNFVQTEQEKLEVT